ncbi:uncharacterized protein C8Q71DRAFT_510671 [Rhodofomes roseus]|uniref:Uncharacterized protein n=1 Tax=Rhodofomes roseus TaxID=34475 RepID=A0ABQ8KNT1_9APHY|nr:uncharacterized protein C8Q71DRAFT_510671 [Rhodofomes roseus]KAH9839407.1 hypothetical protein C8Q71DRAFT_510671 [Rhodofomes roseus]
MRMLSTPAAGSPEARGRCARRTLRLNCACAYSSAPMFSFRALDCACLTQPRPCQMFYTVPVRIKIPPIVHRRTRQTDITASSRPASVAIPLPQTITAAPLFLVLQCIPYTPLGLLGLHMLADASRGPPLPTLPRFTCLDCRPIEPGVRRVATLPRTLSKHARTDIKLTLNSTRGLARILLSPAHALSSHLLLHSLSYSASRPSAWLIGDNACSDALCASRRDMAFASATAVEQFALPSPLARRSPRLSRRCPRFPSNWHVGVGVPIQVRGGPMRRQPFPAGRRPAPNAAAKLRHLCLPYMCGIQSRVRGFVSGLPNAAVVDLIHLFDSRARSRLTCPPAGTWAAQHSSCSSAPLIVTASYSTELGLGLSAMTPHLGCCPSF